MLLNEVAYIKFDMKFSHFTEEAAFFVVEGKGITADIPLAYERDGDRYTVTEAGEYYWVDNEDGEGGYRIIGREDKQALYLQIKPDGEIENGVLFRIKEKS